MPADVRGLVPRRVGGGVELGWADMWRDVLKFLETARFTDLLFGGWMDRSGRFPVFRSFDFEVYLQAEAGLVKFASVNSSGGLRIRLVDELEFDEDFLNDPDEEPAAGSAGVQYLGGSDPVRCTALRLFTNNESVPDEGVFRAAEMTFENNSTVFIDPFWIEGIRLGTGNTPDLWLAEHRSDWGLRLFGPLEETLWEAQGSAR